MYLIIPENRYFKIWKKQFEFQLKNHYNLFVRDLERLGESDIASFDEFCKASYETGEIPINDRVN